MNLLHTISSRAFASLLGLMVCIYSADAANDAIPKHIQSELHEARISGKGSFRWFGLKIYDAVLWIDKDGYQPGTPIAAKFILDLSYARDLDGARIAQSSIDEIRQLGYGSADQQAQWLHQMTAMFPDVHEGTHISGVYLPQKGARFYLDGKLLGQIDNPEFARAFFAIWLDERTSDAKLRSQLLATDP